MNDTTVKVGVTWGRLGFGNRSTFVKGGAEWAGSEEAWILVFLLLLTAGRSLELLRSRFCVYKTEHSFLFRRPRLGDLALTLLLWFCMGFTGGNIELMITYPNTTWHHFHPVFSELPSSAPEIVRPWWCAFSSFQPFSQGHDVGIGFLKTWMERLYYGLGLQKLGLCSIYFSYLLKWQCSRGQYRIPKKGERGVWWIAARDRQARWRSGKLQLILHLAELPHRRILWSE